MGSSDTGFSKMRRRWLYSLKNRLIVVLLLCSVTPLILIGSISHYSMYSILENKAERGLRSNLHQVRLSLENTLSQLNHASQQLAFDGSVGQSLEKFLLADLYEKKQLNDEIVRQLSLINFTNPALGLTFYFITGTDTRMFENFPIRGHVRMDELPMLMKTSKITYYGPHKSLNAFDGNLVFSVVRRVELPERSDVSVYIETNFKLTESIINAEPFDDNIVHLIVDNNGKIVFSENADQFPVGGGYPAVSADRNVVHAHYLFEETSNQGWKIAAAVPKSLYESEINRWIWQFVLLTMLSLAASLLLGLIVWRSVYRPLRNLSRDIREVKDNNLQFPARWSRIMEFDAIHYEFLNMRKRIVELIDEVETKEKRKAELEVEKLIHQINPHFLYNTLDAVRWLARANGQAEIDRLASMLNKLLHYNLGKGGQAFVRDELEALKNYVAIQSIRYNFQFNVTISADPDTLHLPVPRFILQPLVENALYHGLHGQDDGIIEVDIQKDGESHILVQVKDNGAGMVEEDFRRLTQGDNRARAGMGIGLQYVQRMIEHQFGTEADLRIESAFGSGTTIVLRLPVLQEGRQTG